MNIEFRRAVAAALAGLTLVVALTACGKSGSSQARVLSQCRRSAGPAPVTAIPRQAW